MLALLAATLIRQSDSIQIREALVIEGVSRGGRVPFSTDSVQKAVVEGTWSAPKEGDTLGSSKWVKVVAKADGNIEPSNPGGAYAYSTVDSPDDHIALLTAVGDGMVYVNGVPRAGDPYGYGYVTIPVDLHKGTNSFLFALGRSGIHAKLDKPKSSHVFSLGDTTFPDVREGEKGKAFGAVIVINATNSIASNLHISAKFGDGESTSTKVPPIPPMTMRKVPVNFVTTGQEKAGDIPLQISLGKEDEAKLTLRVRKREQTYKRTFLSRVDGSVQYYAVNPAPVQRPGQGIALSLHGASVEAIGQADAYSSKDWCNIVCPTNRRPYGFDWEGIGRIDALEVLDAASADLKPDPRQIYLCGHSMGGHGSWTVGAHYPDKFAVVFPSAGWQSFYTYAGQKRRAGESDPMGQIFDRAVSDSDTALLVDNLKLPALYGLHGDADSNVPVTELRNMRTLLRAHGIEMAGYHEQPGADHWWDADPAPGADCVDWNPAFEMMHQSKRTLAEDLKPVDFTTVNVGASSKCEWVEVMQQAKPGLPSRIQTSIDATKNEAQVTTSNVNKFKLELPDATWKVTIDGTEVEAKSPLTYAKTDGKWQISRLVNRALPRGSDRSGPFGQVFANHIAFVYATHGTPEENAWSYNKARFDAETLLVRGNGAVDIIPDTAVKQTNERNLMIYTTGKSNSALKLCYGEPFDPFHQVALGGESAPMGALILSPGRNRFALYGIVQGNDLIGCRLLDRLGLFSSGIGYPDWMIATTDVLAHGVRGVVGAGFFDAHWAYDASNSEWVKP